MSYFINRNKYNTQPDGNFLANNRSNIYSKESEFYELEPGEVLDIILDNTHPEFKSFEDIGKIKVRLLYSQENLNINDLNNLSWVKPLNIHNTQYPLLHEIVRCGYYIGLESTEENIDNEEFPLILYYDNIINTNNSCNNNALMGISIDNEGKQINNYNPKELILGDKFKSSNIHPLRHNEGDFIYQGRTGQSIRFGSEGGKGKYPNILIRCGQPDKYLSNSNISEYIDEDINEDDNSLWLTSNEIIPLELVSKENSSIINPPTKLNGKQILLNSDRIILNSKKNEIILSSNKEILLSSNKEIGFNAKDRIVLDSKNIYLGNNKATEPLVLGNQLFILLYKLLVQLSFLTVTTPAGVSSPPNNVNNITSLIKELKTILSKQNYTL